MAETFSMDDLPPKLLVEILSRLTWRQQLAVRRVSRAWQAAADDCLAHRQELYISNSDFREARITTETLLCLLQKMPAVQQLRVDSHHPCSQEGRDHDEETPRESPLMSRSCPLLTAGRPVCMLDETCVETLLRALPHLRFLTLTGMRNEGDFLSLLPKGLQSLELINDLFPYPSLTHLGRCSQLRQLHLSVTRVRSDELKAILPRCNQLEQLTVSSCGEHIRSSTAMSDWLPELRHCPRLQQLDISGLDVQVAPDAKSRRRCRCRRGKPTDCRHLRPLRVRALLNPLPPFDLDRDLQLVPDIPGVLAACRSLKRLRVCDWLNPLSLFPIDGLPGLTHLDLSNTKTDDTAFRQLPDLLPSLQDLRIEWSRGIADNVLTSVLPRLTGLQVLDLRCTGNRSTKKLVASLKELPLKALAYNHCGDMSLSGMLRHLRSLAVVYPTPGPKGTYVNFIGLSRNPLPTDRHVTLIVEPCFAAWSSPVPENIRVEDRSGVWEELVGWGYPSIPSDQPPAPWRVVETELRPCTKGTRRRNH